jgi:hypothetical protein
MLYRHGFVELHILFFYEEIRDEYGHIFYEWLMICGLVWFGDFLYVW